MVGIMRMIRSTKGFYTLEAAIFLPLVILAVFSLGYFMKVEGVWENTVHAAVEESRIAASKAYNNISSIAAAGKIKTRITEENPEIKSVKLKDLKMIYSDSYENYLTSYRIKALINLDLPLGFGRDFELDYGIRYRGFVGDRRSKNPLGTEGLESYEQENPVWVFPQAGEKYHTENCTYVKASAEAVILTGALRRKCDSCSLCNSKTLPLGSLVFCFSGEDTAYHRGTCRTVDRHTVVIDRTDADKRGYAPCSKCGG